MNILMLSLDKKIMEKDSLAQRRHFEYGQICKELDVIVLQNCDTRFVQEENVKIAAANGKNKAKILYNAYKKAKKIIKTKKIDLITTQDTGFTGLIGYLLKKKYKVKLNVQVHGSEEKLLNKILFFFFKKRIIKSADTIRVVSERLKKEIIKKYKILNEKIFVIPIYANIEKFKNVNVVKKEKKDCFTILTVGRLVKVKNIALQIEALADIVKIFPKTKLVIVGDGKEKANLQKKAEKFKMQNNVVFVGSGWNKNFDLISYYKNADLFVLTSNKEGWGLVVVEAMASGCPVIMTDVGCAGELVKNEKNGLIIPINNKKALISAICDMISDVDKRNKFSTNAKLAVDNLPNEKATMEMYRGMWEK